MSQETYQAPSVAHQKPRRWHWTPVLLLLLGLLSIVMLVWTWRASELQAVQGLGLDDALRRLEIGVVTSHLWLEEHLTGDESVDVQAIWKDLDRAIELLFVVVRGGAFEPGGQILEPLNDPMLLEQAETLRILLVELRHGSFERLRQGAGIGTPMDQSFDETFRQVLLGSENLRSRLAERTFTLHVAANARIRMVMLAWAFLVFSAVGLLWSHETRRQGAEWALHQREEELRQAQKMEAVGRLAGGIAHDINNYLGAVRAHCEVAKMKNESGEALDRRMDSAMATITKASALIKQLLAFSRRQPVKPEIVDLNRVVSGLGGLMNRLLGEDITLQIDCQEELRHIKIDPSQIEQVLANLLVNSREAMPKGGAIVVATHNDEVGVNDSTHPARTPGPYVRLTVRDTGSGIPPELQNKVFEPFFTTKSESASSGLGLATVYSVVQQNGGFVTLRSSKQEGTTFEIFLPASDGALTVREENHPVPTSEFAVRVLLVEDHDEMRTSSRDMLESLGHQVQTANNGKEALHKLSGDGQEFDLLISDVVMPGLSGTEMLEEIRQGGCRLPCLFISGYTSSVVLRQILDQEGVDFLQKPFDLGSLVHKMNALVKR
jgi:signal transduction histidine kinase